MAARKRDRFEYRLQPHRFPNFNKSESTKLRSKPREQQFSPIESLLAKHKLKRSTSKPLLITHKMGKILDPKVIDYIYSPNQQRTSISLLTYQKKSHAHHLFLSSALQSLIFILKCTPKKRPYPPSSSPVHHWSRERISDRGRKWITVVVSQQMHKNFPAS